MKKNLLEKKKEIKKIRKWNQGEELLVVTSEFKVTCLTTNSHSLSATGVARLVFQILIINAVYNVAISISSEVLTPRNMKAEYCQPKG